MNDELKKLLDHSVEYASELLVETGESYPFGAYLDTIGNVHPLEMEIDMKNVPKLERVVENLANYCKQEMAANRMKGYCLSYEVAIQLDEQTNTDAIAFELHHRDEKNIPGFYLPYTITGEKRAQPGELFAVNNG